jgi:hypothetical protein
MRCSAGLLVLLLSLGTAHAETTATVTLSPEGMMLAQAMGISPAELAAQIKTRVDDAYHTGEINSFLKEFTDATSFSQRGIGVDYSSAPTGFMVGMAANLALAGDPDIHDTDHPTGGIAVNFSILLGMNLSEWKHEKWTIFANGFYQSASLGDLEGSITSAGAHVQYNVVAPAKSGGAGTALRWLGLSLTSGLEYTRWNFGTGGTTLSTKFDVSGGGMTQPITLNSTGRFDLRSNAVTVPIEVTTGIRIALISTLFVGAGIDLTPVGNSTVSASLDGVLNTDDGRDLGDVNISGNGDSDGSRGQFRLLAGGQVNLWKLKIFAQANVSQAPAASIAVGLKFVQ